ncbi:hypothetical protein ACUR5C_02725 [Aliikangiella sp. IMCC44653]
MNQTIQNFVLTLAVLLIFMFGYFYLKPQVPQNKLVTLQGVYKSDLVEWRWFVDCESQKEYLLTWGITEQLDKIYQEHAPDGNKSVYVEVDGRLVYKALNGTELLTELVINKVNKIVPNKDCNNQ